MILLIVFMREIIQTKVPFWVTALGIFTVIVLLCDLIPKLVALSKPSDSDTASSPSVAVSTR